MLPSTLKRIEYNAFKNCIDLERIIFPENLEFIGKMSFEDSSLEEIQIPEKVIEIKEKAFKNCSALVSVSVPQNS